MKTFHAAVNHIEETKSNVLCRLKELGDKAPSIRIPKKVFGAVLPAKHENFVVEVEGLAQDGNYLIPLGACKVISREIGTDAQPFDVDAYLASLTDSDAPF